MNNRLKLIELITEHKLDRRDVAAMLSVKPSLIDHWLLSPESKNHEDIPQMAIELLELKLKFKRQDDRPS